MNITDIIRKRHSIGADDPIGFAVSAVESLRMKEWSDDQPPVFSGVATSAVVDLDDEVVVPDGLDWSYALRFRAMYPSHQNYGTGPIAKLNNVQLKDGRWLFTAVFLKANPMARDFYAIAKELGTMGVSIGFKVLDAGRPTDSETKEYGPHKSIIRSGAVLELSPTFMPANPDAVAEIRAKGAALQGDSAKTVERMVRLGKVNRKTYDALTRGTKTIVIV